MEKTENDVEQITGADSKGHAAVAFASFYGKRNFCEGPVPLAACSFHRSPHKGIFYGRKSGKNMVSGKEIWIWMGFAHCMARLGCLFIISVVDHFWQPNNSQVSG